MTINKLKAVELPVRCVQCKICTNFVDILANYDWQIQRDELESLS